MPTVPFTKAHAYGNDFLIVREVDVAGMADVATTVTQACDRHRGIGADGVMLVAETPAGATTRLFNADGSMSELSGNGLRCVGAWLAFERNLSAGDGLTIGTKAGSKSLTFLGATNRVTTFRASMGVPEGIRQVTLDVAHERVTAVARARGHPPSASPRSPAVAPHP